MQGEEHWKTCKGKNIGKHVRGKTSETILYDSPVLCLLHHVLSNFSDFHLQTRPSGEQVLMQLLKGYSYTVRRVVAVLLKQLEYKVASLIQDLSVGRDGGLLHSVGEL